MGTVPNRTVLVRMVPRKVGGPDRFRAARHTSVNEIEPLPGARGDDLLFDLMTRGSCRAAFD